MAAMPSFAGKSKLGVAVLTAAILALSASAASANEAWVWACHGPSSSMPIGTAMQSTVKVDGAATSNCAGDDTTGATLRFNGATPGAGSVAQVEIQLPPGTTASKVRIFHAVHGSATGGRYIVTLGGAPIVNAALDAPVTTLPTDITQAGSGSLTFSLSCSPPAGSATCTQGADPVSVDIVKVAVLVNDTKAPYGSVNRNSPTNRFTQLIASAIEEGVGFSHADTLISTTPSDANVVTSRSVGFGKGACADLTPGDATIDLPLDSRCETGSGSAKFTTVFVPGPNPGDPPVEKVGDSLDTSGLPEGIYYRRVIAYDAVGNAQDLLNSNGSVWEAFEVWHPVLGSPTQTLSIGSSATSDPVPQPNVKPNQNGSQGNASTACRSPRLSVSLGQKPLRVSKSVAVLQYGKRYRFEGRLSCVVNGRRISAPKRTKVQLLNKVGKKTVTKTGPKIADKGRFKLTLKYPRGSRTLIFRFTNSTGQRSQVSIKIKTETKKKSAKR